MRRHRALLRTSIVALIAMLVFETCAAPAAAVAVEPAAPAPEEPPKADPTELPELRTATSQTIDNHDGTLTTTFFTDPVFYRPDGATGYEPIEASFATDARTKAVVSTKAPVAVSLNPDRSLHVESGDVSISLTPFADGSGARPSGVQSDPVADGRTADLADAFPGVDLRVFARADGASTFLVVDEPPAEPVWTFALEAPWPEA